MLLVKKLVVSLVEATLKLRLLSLVFDHNEPSSGSSGALPVIAIAISETDNSSTAFAIF